MQANQHPFLPGFPSYELIVALEPEELALHVLRLAQRTMQNGIVTADAVIDAVTRVPPGQGHVIRGPVQDLEVQTAVAEAFEWLRIHLLVVRDPGYNGNNGFVRIARRGARLLANPDSFEAFRRGIAFPKELLHPAIAEKVWIRLARGEFDDAVFVAFKAVEESVRAAGRYPVGMQSSKMMRAAFHPETGPLTDPDSEASERQALSDLFHGAHGTQRNPVSHRTVETSAADAQAMVMLASYLLRVVDARAATYQPPDSALP